MAEIYCFICGGDPKIKNILYAHIMKELGLEAGTVTPPPDTRHAYFSPHDIVFQTDLCLVGPLNTTNNDPIFNPAVCDPNQISAIDLNTVRYIRNMGPTDLRTHGIIIEKGTNRSYRVNGNTYPFMHTACADILFNQLVRRGYTRPEVVFWAIVRHFNLHNHGARGIAGIDYGEDIMRTQAVPPDGSQPLANIRQTQYGVDLLNKIIQSIQNGSIEKSLMTEYWMNCGKMWLFTSPFVFPVRVAPKSPFLLGRLPPLNPGTAAIEQLPVELIVLIAKSLPDLAELTKLLILSKTIRDAIGWHIDAIVRVLAPEWMMPHPRGRSKGGYTWLKYVHACNHMSPSMRNRIRIWRICEQIVRLADSMRPEDLGQITAQADEDSEMQM